MTRAALVALAVVAGLAFLGCGSSPASTFYALSPTPPSSPQPIGIHAIRLRRPSIAGYLDRPEILERIVSHRLVVASTERWGAPLDVMIGRVLAEDVESRLPGSSVYTEDGAITADPDATVEVDIQRFDVGEGGELRLVAEVAVEIGDAHGESASRAVRLSVHPRDAAAAELVSAMSDLTGQLADQIVVALREGRASQPPSKASSP